MDLKRIGLLAPSDVCVWSQTEEFRYQRNYQTIIEISFIDKMTHQVKKGNAKVSDISISQEKPEEISELCIEPRQEDLITAAHQ